MPKYGGRALKYNSCGGSTGSGGIGHDNGNLNHLMTGDKVNSFCPSDLNLTDFSSLDLRSQNFKAMDDKNIAISIAGKSSRQERAGTV